MKWQFKYMIDPGDGIVAVDVIEHHSDDITEVATDIWNGDVPGIPRDQQHAFNKGGWLFSVEAIHEEPED